MPFHAGKDDLTAGQYRAARAILGLSVFEASERAKVSVATVAMIERGRGAHDGRRHGALRVAYEAAGVRFFGVNDFDRGLSLGPVLTMAERDPRSSVL